jgi:hypothetical protein
MSHPLDGARLKVVRAQKHLESFNEEAWRYINTEPHQVIAKREGNIVTVECLITAELDPSLACIVGDFVTNLRAALDYVIWELFIRFGPTTLTDGQKGGIAFPIVASGNADFSKPNGKAAKLSGLCGIPAPAISVIESVQPYHAGYEALGTLNLLVNRDKHRMLLLCGVFVDSKGELVILQGDRPLWRTFGGIKSRFNLDAWGPKLAGCDLPFNVKVESKPTIYIALKDFPTPPTLTYVGVLEDALKCVANVIPRFEPFF